MKFWGAEVQGGKPLKVKPGDDCRIHVSQASFDKEKNGETSHLYVTFDRKKYLMGTLSQDKNPQISFDLSFEKDFQLSHTSQGSVHFTGYKSPNVDEESPNIDEEHESDIKRNYKSPNIDAEHGSDFKRKELIHTMGCKSPDPDDENGSDIKKMEVDGKEEETHNPGTSNKKKKRLSEAETNFSAKKSKKETDQSDIFEWSQRLKDLVESHDPLTTTYLHTFSKEISQATSFPSFHVNKFDPYPDDPFASKRTVGITNLNDETKRDDVYKFLKDNNLKVKAMDVFVDPDTNKKEAQVVFHSRKAMEKAMEMTGRRIYSSANKQYTVVYFCRTKNGLRVFYLTGYDETLPEETIKKQIKVAFTSKKASSATVKNVVMPRDQTTGNLQRFCYLIMDNVTSRNKADVLAVTMVGGKRIQVELCTPRPGVFDPYLK